MKRSLSVLLLAPLTGCGEPAPAPPQHLTEQACTEHNPSVVCRRVTSTAGGVTHFVYTPWMYPYYPSPAVTSSPSLPFMSRPSTPAAYAPSAVRSGFGATAARVGAGAASS